MTAATSEGLVGRFNEIERRLSALERKPSGLDVPIIFDPVQDLAASGRSVPVYTDAPTWTMAYTTFFDLAMFPGVYMEAHVLTPAGTTAELRLINWVQGGASSGIYTVPANTDWRGLFRWLHGQPLKTGPFAPSIEARRTSGTGTVQVFQPTSPHLVTQLTVNQFAGAPGENPPYAYSTDGRVS